jgi:two-component system sensor histidine kinase RegB
MRQIVAPPLEQAFATVESAPGKALMTDTPLTALPALNQNLWRLALLRVIVLVAIVAAIITTTRSLGLDLPVKPLYFVTALYSGLTLLVFWRLLRAWPVTELEFAIHLSSDALLLSSLLYFTGGAANPFVSLYLLWVVIAATTLAAGYAWFIAALAVACYTLLMNFNVPLVSEEHRQHMDHFGLHVIGMWANFLVSAVLIAWFVVRMARAIQDRDRRLAEVREKALRDDKILSLGLLAAGAAHELATPLSTIKVLVSELERDAQSNEQRDDLRTLSNQVEVCRNIIQGLASSAGQGRANAMQESTVSNFLHQTIDRWQLLRPGIPIQSHVAGAVETLPIVTDDTLGTTLISLLNNAANASPSGIELVLDRDATHLTLEIFDRGPGVDDNVARDAGKAMFINKSGGKGLGIGLFLANATVERLGGTIVLLNREGGGACTRLRLPIDKMQGRSG